MIKDKIVELISFTFRVLFVSIGIFFILRRKWLAGKGFEISKKLYTWESDGSFFIPLFSWLFILFGVTMIVLGLLG